MKDGFSTRAAGATLGLALLSVLALPAHAESGVYAGGGVLLSEYSENDTNDFTFNGNLSLLVGYAPVGWNGFGVEGQLAEGRIEYAEDVSGDPLSFDYTSFGTYGVFRAGDRFFFKGRVGAIWQKWDSNDRADLNKDEVNAAAGIGFGWRFGRGKVELERLFTDSDLRQISVNYSHSF